MDKFTFPYDTLIGQFPARPNAVERVEGGSLLDTEDCIWYMSTYCGQKSL